MHSERPGAGGFLSLHADPPARARVPRHPQVCLNQLNPKSIKSDFMIKSLIFSRRQLP
jgi:hypothetical protein